MCVVVGTAILDVPQQLTRFGIISEVFSFTILDVAIKKYTIA